MKRDTLRRFSISMPAGLVGQLDAMIEAKGYANRSQGIAELARDRLVEHHARRGRHKIAGTITLVYDHHKPNLQSALTALQHAHHDLILATTHVHLDPHNCLEVLVLRGPADRIHALADRLVSTKGIKHGKLTVTTTGKDFDT